MVKIENWREKPGPDPAGSVSQDKEFGLHPRSNGGPLRDSKEGSDVIRYALERDALACVVENRLEGKRQGVRERS